MEFEISQTKVADCCVKSEEFFLDSSHLPTAVTSESVDFPLALPGDVRKAILNAEGMCRNSSTLVLAPCSLFRQSQSNGISF